MKSLDSETRAIINQKNATIRSAYKEIEKLKAELQLLRQKYAKTLELKYGK